LAVLAALTGVAVGLTVGVVGFAVGVAAGVAVNAGAISGLAVAGIGELYVVYKCWDRKRFLDLVNSVEKDCIFNFHSDNKSIMDFLEELYNYWSKIDFSLEDQPDSEMIEQLNVIINACSDMDKKFETIWTK